MAFHYSTGLGLSRLYLCDPSLLLLRDGICVILLRDYIFGSSLLHKLNYLVAFLCSPQQCVLSCYSRVATLPCSVNCLSLLGITMGHCLV